MLVISGYIVGLISLTIGTLSLFKEISISWFYIILVLNVFLTVFVIVKSRRDKIRLNAALRIGLEWIRKLYDTDDSDAIRVSYFKIRCNSLNNIARAPLGTELTPVRFKRGEGFAGLLWQQFVYNSNSNYIRSSNLPAAKDGLSELIRLLHKKGVKLDINSSSTPC